MYIYMYTYIYIYIYIYICGARLRQATSVKPPAHARDRQVSPLARRCINVMWLYVYNCVHVLDIHIYIYIHIHTNTYIIT